MARLASHGPAVLRISKTRQTPDSALTVWTRKTLSFHPDGVVLRKNDHRERATRYQGERNYPATWKRYAKVKRDKTAAWVIETLAKPGGWTIELAPTNQDELHTPINTDWKRTRQRNQYR